MHIFYAAVVDVQLAEGDVLDNPKVNAEFLKTRLWLEWFRMGTRLGVECGVA